MNYGTTANFQTENTLGRCLGSPTGLAQPFPKRVNLLRQGALRCAYHSRPGGVPHDAVHGSGIAPGVLMPPSFTEDGAIHTIHRYPVNDQGLGLLGCAEGEPDLGLHASFPAPCGARTMPTNGLWLRAHGEALRRGTRVRRGALSARALLVLLQK